LYLDLMKKALLHALWPDPGVPIEQKPRHNAVSRAVAGGTARLLDSWNLQLVKKPRVDPARREEGQDWPACADTMIGLKRLDNIQFCAQSAIRDNVPGDLIETGVWKGGACIFMRACLAAYGVTDRRVFVADSFQGLPPPDEEHFPQDKGDRHHTKDALAISQETVASNFRRYGLLDDQVVFLKGWFKDTLPNAPIEKLAVMRLDGDMYESTIQALDALYHKLSPGGFCIIDDFALKGCRQAVEDYRGRHGVKAEIMKVDWTGAYWRKD
jgi:hypothetical protein